MKKIFIAIVAVLLVGAGIWFFSKGNAGPVAIVNGEEISRTQYKELESQIEASQGVSVKSLDQETRAQLQAQILDSLVSQTLLAQAAARSGIAVTDAEVEVQMQAIKGQFPDEATLAQALLAEGLTEQKLRAQVKRDLNTQAYFAQELDFSSIAVSEEEIVAAYDEVASTQDIPALEEVRSDVEEFILQEKQQELILAHLNELRAEAAIEVLI